MDTIEFAREIRSRTLEMVYNAKASHIGGAFSMADILAVLYGSVLKIDPAEPKAADRDRFILSKGHACTSLYSTLAIKGFFDIDLLDTYSKDGSFFMAHTSHKVPGVELSTGSLGHAMPVACGMALAAKRKSEKQHIYVLVSDGELDEGSNWEAILFAAHHHLNNLTCIVDYNKIQSLGRVDDVIQLDPLKDKFVSFNWDVVEVDGHDHDQLLASFNNKTLTDKPRCIIAHTIKGKGVDFMQDDLKWHYQSPSADQYSAAQKQL
ncbi:MAG: putative transketolase N-terminal part [Ferruginibacter sp.]|nr:putative transketolase N-terminal part [Ferruginibacter sp.]